MQQRLPSLLDDPIAFAHRGARAHAPENTLAAFDLALKLGVNGLESDIWVTADGVPVMDHDGVVRGRFRRTTPISQVLRADLPAHVPSLAEMVEHCGTAFHLSLDVRNNTAARRTVEVLTDLAPSMLPRVWLCSANWQSLLPYRGSGVKLVDSTRLSAMKEGPERRAATLAKEGVDAVNLFHTDWNGGLVTLFHRFERVSFGWGVQETHQLESMLRMGIDGVYSDYADRLVEAYQQTTGPIRPIPRT